MSNLHSGRLLLGAMLAVTLFWSAGALAQSTYSLLPIRPFFFPLGINDRGQLVGATFGEATGGPGFGAVWTPGATPPWVTLGAPTDSVNDINNAGQVAGDHHFPSGVIRAVVFERGGSFHDLGTLGGRSSTAAAINDAGEVTGTSETGGGDSHAFLYSNGSMQDLRALAGGQSRGSGINDRGQVVGSASFAPGAMAPEHAFLYSDGIVTDLGTFGMGRSGATSINNAGQVVGYAAVGEATDHPFLYQDGVMTDIGTLGGGFGIAHAINNSGDIVGSAGTADGEGHGFIYADGRMTDLNTLIDAREGWTVYSAFAINDHGDIGGYACRPYPDQVNAYDCTGVFLSPVPEPAPRMLWLGALVAGWAGRRRLQSSA